MKNILRRILFGDTEIREYATVTLEGLVRESVWLKSGRLYLDISEHHWLVCLEPVVFAVWITKYEPDLIADQENQYKIGFSGTHGNPKSMVAETWVQLSGSIPDQDGTLYLFSLIKSRIYHLNFIKTYLLYYRYYRKPGFPFSKLKAFASAYSFPRKVRVVSFREDGYFNIFPMDLVGYLPEAGRHLFGLRHTNVTLEKIIATGKIVISEVSFLYKDVIYGLGKHHGGNPPSEDSLPFKVRKSKTYGFPVPEWANSYKEVRIIKTMNLGSHMLMWGEVINQEFISESNGHLFHIHFLHYLHQLKRKVDYPLV